MSSPTSWQPGARNPRLKTCDVHVWAASLRRSRADLEPLQAILSAEEMARARRFAFEGDRDAYIAGRGILRRLLGRYTNQEPRSIAFACGPKGKPALAANTREAPLQFNLAHTKEEAVFALTRSGAVGIDIERTDREIDAMEVARRFFSPHEIRDFEVLAESERNEGFFLCWTRKEAYVKAVGDGLHVALDSFDVSLKPGEEPTLSCPDGCTWHLASFAVTTRCVGAIVTEHTKPEFSFYNWDVLE
jgi:4'-phosphopantetheinyl transferase